MAEDAEAHEMFVLIEGSKSVVVEKGGKVLGVMSAGDFFGELGAVLPPSVRCNSYVCVAAVPSIFI
jgi:CRP-like cAMP-binding protein